MKNRIIFVGHLCFVFGIIAATDRTLPVRHQPEQVSPWTIVSAVVTLLSVAILAYAAGMEHERNQE